MELELIRLRRSPLSTIGDLSIGGIYECVTLERAYGDPVFKPIPEGRYPVNIRWSNKFGREIPHIDGVPGRNAIEIHFGNTFKDTDGCILVGTESGKDEIFNSKIAFGHLFPQLKTTIDPIFITVQLNKGV